MPAACRAASAAHMRRGVERQPRLSSHPCHARRRAPCAPVGALAVLHQPARRGAMYPGHCVGRQPACLSTEQERMLRTLAQHHSPPIKHSHHCTAAHKRPQLHCSTLKLRSLPLLSQLCAVQRASSAAPGRPVARPGGCGTEARRASASRIGGHVSRSRERAAQRGRVAHAFAKRLALTSLLEHLECSHQPHIQGRGAEERTQRAG